jgi:hypothetical protein
VRVSDNVTSEEVQLLAEVQSLADCIGMPSIQDLIAMQGELAAIKKLLLHPPMKRLVQETSGDVCVLDTDRLKVAQEALEEVYGWCDETEITYKKLVQQKMQLKG